MAQPSVSSSHPLPGPDDAVLPAPIERIPPAEVGDDLMSQLAGDAIERMMSNRGSGPVEQLTAQIGAFFEQLQERQTIAAVISSEERRELEREILDIPEARPIEDPAALFGLVERRPSALLRPLDWCGSVVESLSPRMRFMLSATSAMSFVAGCAAVVYVLMIR